jgi:Uma2 family endonuclease
MGLPKIDTGPMTVDEFYLFTDARPDEEKWELIDGEPILNASPSPFHQRILKNIVYTLAARERESDGAWEMLPGLGVRVSDTKRPEPDVLILPNVSGDDSAKRDRDDVIVAFEIMSPSTASRDLKWKRTAYTSLATLTHYVVIAQDVVEVLVFARDSNFIEQRYRSASDVIAFPALGVSLPLSEIYRGTGLS